MTGYVNYRLWLCRLIAWDGILPAFVLLTPIIGLMLLGPLNADIVIVVASVFVPNVVLIMRMKLGVRHIQSNNCSALLKTVQCIFLLVAIFILFCCDVLLVIIHLMPAGQAFEKNQWSIFGLGYCVYLTLMSIAMYPGRTPIDEFDQVVGEDYECAEHFSDRHPIDG